jgi:RNA polymerase sigma factor (sigma-70 family)
MDTTNPSLLLRIKDPRDVEAWSQFHALYAPLLYRYACAQGLSHEDAEDVRATCYETVVRQIAGFDYQKSRGGFKAWLRTLVSRRVIDLRRKRKEFAADSRELDEIPAREPPLDEVWEQQWREQHLRYCVEQVAKQVPDATFQAFQLLVRDECTAQEVCDRLGLTANQVYKAKARVLELVRAKMAEIDSDSGE